MPGLYQGDPTPGSEFLAAQISGPPVCRTDLHCSMQIQGCTRQHQAACGASCSDACILATVVHRGKKNLLSDKFVGTLFWLATWYVVNRTLY